MADFDTRFESKNQTWTTPQDLFDHLDREFHFTRDVCASSENTKVDQYWSEEDSCLDKAWDGVNWMNPPFKNMKAFIKKAFNERDHAVTVMLIPARTNTNWWHEWCMKGEIRFICGRPKFGDGTHGLPLPLAIVIFGHWYDGVMSSLYLKEVTNGKDLLLSEQQ